MEIRIDNKYLITSDKRQFILNELHKHKENGEEYYIAVAYYVDFISLMESIANRKLLSSTATELSQVIFECKEIRKWLREQLELSKSKQ